MKFDESAELAKLERRLLRHALEDFASDGPSQQRYFIHLFAVCLRVYVRLDGSLAMVGLALDLPSVDVCQGRPVFVENAHDTRCLAGAISESLRDCLPRFLATAEFVAARTKLELAGSVLKVDEPKCRNRL